LQYMAYDTGDFHRIPVMRGENGKAIVK
jgi:hypothetical protein